MNVGNATMAEGGSAEIDVFIRSDDGTDLLAIFNAEFNITANPPTATQLKFIGSQTTPQYVFLGNSLGFLGTIDNGLGTPDSRFIGGDSTLDTLDVALPTPSLGLVLVRLQVMGGSGTNAPLAGDTFSVTMANPGSVLGGDNTFFSDMNFVDQDFNLVDSNLVGIVTVTSAVIPEPSSFMIACTLLLTFGLYYQFPRLVTYAKRRRCA